MIMLTIHKNFKVQVKLCCKWTIKLYSWMLTYYHKYIDWSENISKNAYKFIILQMFLSYWKISKTLLQRRVKCVFKLVWLSVDEIITCLHIKLTMIKEKTNPTTTNLQWYNSEILKLNVSSMEEVCCLPFASITYFFAHVHVWPVLCENFKISKYTQNRKLVLQKPEKGIHSASPHVNTMSQIS